MVPGLELHKDKLLGPHFYFSITCPYSIITFPNKHLKHLLNLQLLKSKSAYVSEQTVVNSNIPALIPSGNTSASGFSC